MATLECKSAQRNVPSAFVEVDNITDAEVSAARAEIDRLLDNGGQISDAVAMGFVHVLKMCPKANPSDLWQHVVYRHLLEAGWSDQRWKRVSGFALERAIASIYNPVLKPSGVRLRILPTGEANTVLAAVGIKDVKSTKVDLFIEGYRDDDWVVFGSAHVKSSIAERIQDDVPASLSFMQAGLLSVAITMDAKSYPPPHGNCINYGELGGRSFAADENKVRLKRSYIENAGQFDALFSYNLRTPPSAEKTPSMKRIHRMSFSEPQPDAFVSMLVERWKAHPNAIDV